MRILLHICCAPCAIHPFKELSADGKNSVTGFFYNPNIHPAAEMHKRKNTVEDYAKETKLDIVFAEYDTEDFFKAIGDNTDAPARCRGCWRLRLEKAALYAKEKGFQAFTSTLLVSPYQDRRAITDIGGELETRLGIVFLDDDFRPGFRAAQQSARERGMYRQKYCGCIFSEKECINKKRK